MNTNETALAAANRLQSSGLPFALVSVLRVQSPASARPGDKAAVTADGQLHGWIGGGCAQPVVLRCVRDALADGVARVLRIAPAEKSSEDRLDDVLEFGMACHSGGTLELFVDPVLPSPHLVIIGASPVAAALCQLAPRVGFRVTVAAQDVDAAGFVDAHCVLTTDHPDAVLPKVAAGAWVVVATQGKRDLHGLRLALSLSARQVAFVASARKAAVLKSSLLAGGADADAVERIVGNVAFDWHCGK